MYEDDSTKMDEVVNYNKNKAIAEQQWKEKNKYKAKSNTLNACEK